MEIKEIVSYFLNPTSNTLEVTFRTIDDEDDSIRTDNIDYSIVEEYGFSVEVEYDITEEMDEDELWEKNYIVELDEDELTSFLNEYYEVNPTSLPKSELY
jgi:hypothetical protein